MNERKLLTEAEAAVKDKLLAIGIVQPRGAGLSMLAGASFGSGAGGALGGLMGGVGEAVGEGIGVAGGAIAAEQATAHSQAHGGETPYMFLAVSKDRVYLFRGHQTPSGIKLGVVLARFDRQDISIELHSRPLRRIVVIEVLDTGDRWAFEAPRGPMFKDKTVLAVLHGAD
jgi:hypothetical protein